MTKIRQSAETASLSGARTKRGVNGKITEFEAAGKRVLAVKHTDTMLSALDAIDLEYRRLLRELEGACTVETERAQIAAALKVAPAGKARSARITEALKTFDDLRAQLRGAETIELTRVQREIRAKYAVLQEDAKGRYTKQREAAIADTEPVFTEAEADLHRAKSNTDAAFAEAFDALQAWRKEADDRAREQEKVRAAARAAAQEAGQATAP